MEKKDKIRDIRDRLRDFPGGYSVDERELGKIMIIVSTTLFLFSAHAALSFRAAADSVESVNQDLNTVSGIINSDNFQDSVRIIRSLNSGAITQQMNTALDAFEAAESSIEKSEQVEQNLRSNYTLYQWLALLGILGDVAGIAVIYL